MKRKEKNHKEGKLDYIAMYEQVETQACKKGP
jgi:hypothetical protein